MDTTTKGKVTDAGIAPRLSKLEQFVYSNRDQSFKALSHQLFRPDYQIYSAYKRALKKIEIASAARDVRNILARIERRADQ